MPVLTVGGGSVLDQSLTPMLKKSQYWASLSASMTAAGVSIITPMGYPRGE
jgi:hypothetical protein